MADEKDYKKTLNLPQTSFAMKAKLTEMEPAMLRKWETLGLYDKILASRQGRADVRPPRRPALRQRPYPPGDGDEQDPQGLHRQVPDDEGPPRALPPGLGLPRPADRDPRRQAPRRARKKTCRSPSSGRNARPTP